LSEIMRNSVYEYNAVTQRYETVSLLKTNFGYWLYSLEAVEADLK